jgi:DNA-binding HxlR family transcriptional regulator
VIPKHRTFASGARDLARTAQPHLFYRLPFASDVDMVLNVPGKLKSKRRSGCPVSISLEMFGDRWSLLIIRDLMVRAFRTFKQFQESGEGIATNILADRLKRLEAAGIVTAEAEETDARRVNYRLTEKGIDLAPVLLELLIWGARHEETGAPCALIAKMEKNREEVLVEVRRRWRERDPAPLIPKFVDGVARNLARTRQER